MTDKTKSSTSILCELTRLKSQEKYLQCSQVKLKPEHFIDEDGDDSAQKAIQEIEDLKITLSQQMEEQTLASKREVDNMWLFINALRDDISCPERLQNFSMQSIEERIFSMNNMLGKLQEKNNKLLEETQKQILQIETDAPVLLT